MSDTQAQAGAQEARVTRQPTKAHTKSPKQDLPIFRERLAECVRGSGKAHRELTEGINRSYQLIRNLIRGPNHPDLVTVRHLCQELGVTADYLFGLTDVASAQDHPSQYVTVCGVYHGDLIEEYHITIDKKVLASMSPAGESSVKALPVLDDSMAPFLNRGGFMVIDTNATEFREGAIFCVQDNWMPRRLSTDIETGHYLVDHGPHSIGRQAKVSQDKLKIRARVIGYLGGL